MLDVNLFELHNVMLFLTKLKQIERGGMMSIKEIQPTSVAEGSHESLTVGL